MQGGTIDVGAFSVYTHHSIPVDVLLRIELIVYAYAECFQLLFGLWLERFLQGKLSVLHPTYDLILYQQLFGTVGNTEEAGYSSDHED